MGIAQEMVGTICNPFHWTFQAACSLKDQRIFAIHEAFCTKATADIAGHHVNLVRFHLQYLFSKRITQAVDALASHRKLHGFGCAIIFTHSAARFHVVGDQTIILDLNG